MPKNVNLIYCDACHREEGRVHVTMELRMANGKSQRVKLVQFWLCEICERKNRILLERDDWTRNRVASALTPMPTWWNEEQTYHPQSTDRQRHRDCFAKKRARNDGLMDMDKWTKSS